VRCPYCDFAVDVRRPIPHDLYADAVIAELGARRPWFWSDSAGPLVSVYFGGGTPGLWRPDALGRVVTAARQAFGAPAGASLEITVEANPGEVDAAHLAGLRAAGVNRLSLGVQSFEDRLLQKLGRNHDAAAASAAVTAARQVGFDNLSIDLMFGVPGQTLDDWQRTLDACVALAPEHVSSYALSVERGTPFGALDRAGRLPRPDDDAVAAMFSRAQETLAAAGLIAYEVSSYARSGHRARHNSLYWQGAAYLGVGASASSFRPLADGTGWRFTNPRSTDTYLRAARAGGGSPRPANAERRTARDLENEALWLGLRTREGIDRGAHLLRHGRDPLTGREEAAARCVTAGWLQISDQRLCLTSAGVLFADEVATRLWASAPSA
jgi:oxygen-independent coproporphyrinogen-3 oxidase